MNPTTKTCTHTGTQTHSNFQAAAVNITYRKLHYQKLKANTIILTHNGKVF